MKDAIPPAQIRAELDKILASPGFAGAGRLGPFLRYVVDQTLAGEGAGLKEAVLGVEVFQRQADYDPRIDPIVRVEARRLRSRLAEYYDGPGSGDAVRIDLPKGAYAPVFSTTVATPIPRNWRWLWVAAAIGLVLTAVVSAWLLRPRRRPVVAPSIAVLPFVNLSSDPSNEYFSDGLTEELIDSLTKIEGLRVVARSSSFQFKGKPVDIREAGQKLGVGAVVEGSVRKSGDRLRVTAQLISAADGYHLWSQTYERELKDVFAIQEEISRAIVNSLKLKLKTDRGQRYTEHVEAYNLYLKGRYNLNQYSPGGVSKSIEYFEQALKVDPDYAPAYSALATVYMLLGYYREIPEQRPWVKSRQAAEKAIQLDPSLAEAHAARGFALAWQDWKWAEAEKEFKLALELDPGSADAHGAYALAYLMPEGRIEQALAELKQALDIDPNSVLTNMGYSYALLIAGQCDRAIGQYRRTLELVPSRPDTWWDLGMAYACKGDSAGAMESFRKAGRVRGFADWRPGPIELGLAGQADAGRKLAAERGDAYFNRMRSIFAVYSLSVIGERDWAFRYLDKAMKERDPELVWLKIDSRLKNLRDDPRIVPYLKQLGL